MTLFTSAFGLGDAVVLSDLPRAGTHSGRDISIFSPSGHFQTLMSFNPYYVPRVTPFCAVADVLYNAFNLGNGHLIQRLRRAYGLPIDVKPRGCLEVPERSVRRRVAVHFEPGAHSAWQRRHVHHTARALSRGSKAAINKFIEQRPEFEFVEVGIRPSGIKGVMDKTGLPLAESVRIMATCEYFLGIMSGPLHIAAALDLKLVCVVNFPPAELICLPTLKDIDQVESEWFYPQSVILHQEGEGRYVKRVSADNLKKAFDGELYPYWSDRYLSLVSE